jgi:hypothetical protein
LAADDGPRLPAPRRAGEELPNLEAVQAWGIPLDDVEEARLVLCLLSRFLGRGQAQSRSQLYAMMQMLMACCIVDVVQDGEAEAAPHAELAGVAWPHASSVFKRLGIDAEMLERYWLRARNRASDACFPVEWVTCFFPPALWPAVGSLVGWGPEGTRVRLEAAVIALAERRTQKQHRRRAKGSPLASGTVNAWLIALLGLTDELVQLRSQLVASRQPALPVERVEPWTAKPRRPNLRECGVKPSGQDNTGPAIADVQQRLHELARDYQVHPQYPYRRLRRLILLSLTGLLGPRATALRTLNVADFVPDVPGPDGARRDVLEIRPGKTWQRDEVHRLPLPNEIAGWIREWIAINGFETRQQDTPLFPHKKPKPGLKLTYLSQVGFYMAIAGRRHEDGSGQRALVPLNGDPFLGYRAHGLRHTSEVLIQQAAVQLKMESPGRFDHYTPEDFSRAMLGHALERSVADVYRDVSREKLSYLVVDTAWSILWGEGTARLGIDPYAITDTRERVETLRAAMTALSGEQRRLTAEQQLLAARTRLLSGDELLRAHIDSNAAAAKIADYGRQLDTLRDQLHAAEQAHEQARTERVPLPEDLSDEQHEQLLAQALADPADIEPVLEGPFADELTPADLADLYGTTEQTINRWFREGFPPGKPARWHPDVWIIDGPRKKLLPVSAIDRDLLTQAQTTRLTELRHHRARPAPDKDPSARSRA